MNLESDSESEEIMRKNNKKLVKALALGSATALLLVGCSSCGAGDASEGGFGD